MHTVYCISEFIECLKTVRKECVANGNRMYYRGEPKDYGASTGTPSIARNGRLLQNKESDLIRECERRLPMEFAACKSTFEKLVKMQHYEVSTRLLDMTLNPLTALFFALFVNPKSKVVGKHSGDAVVLVYEIPKGQICNYHSDKVSVVANIAVCHQGEFRVESLPNGDAFQSCRDIHYLLHEIRAEKPYFRPEIVKAHLPQFFCVHPLLDNPRIKAQQGVFLLFGVDGDRHHLANVEKSGIRIHKIKIPESAKVQMLEDLCLLGKTFDEVYPDWDGVREYFGSFRMIRLWERKNFCVWKTRTRLFQEGFLKCFLLRS